MSEEAAQTTPQEQYVWVVTRMVSTPDGWRGCKVYVFDNSESAITFVARRGVALINEVERLEIDTRKGKTRKGDPELYGWSPNKYEKAAMDSSLGGTRTKRLRREIRDELFEEGCDMTCACFANPDAIRDGYLSEFDYIMFDIERQLLRR